MPESRTRERTRSAILRAGIATLVAKPSASLAEIADAAGVARSTLHRYFPERTALISALNAFAEQEYAAVIERSRLDEGTGLSAYVRLCSELLESQAIFAWWTHATASNVSDDWSDEDDEVTRRVVRRGQADGSIDAELDAQWLAQHIWASLYLANSMSADGALSPRQIKSQALRTLTKTAAAT